MSKIKNDSAIKSDKQDEVIAPVWPVQYVNTTKAKHDKAMLLLSAEQVAAMKALPDTSKRIRYLTSEGIERARIADILDKKYQHVRNVQVTPLTGNTTAAK